MELIVIALGKIAEASLDALVGLCVAEIGRQVVRVYKERKSRNEKDRGDAEPDSASSERETGGSPKEHS